MKKKDEDAQIQREAAARRQAEKMRVKQRLGEMAASMPKLQPTEFGDPVRVEWHIWNWQRYMRQDPKQGSYGKVAQGLSSGGISQDFDSMADAMDKSCAIAFHEMVCEMPPAQRLAIYVYAELLPAVFRFRGDALVRAKESISRWLKRRYIW